jgi:cytochrome c peroxidase
MKTTIAVLLAAAWGAGAWLNQGASPENGSGAADVRTPEHLAGDRVLRLPETQYSYAKQALPKHFKALALGRLDNTPQDNPITDAGATLGRVLFYDTRLSVNDTISCASCHQQKHAFADPRRYSKGHAGKEGDRNAMSLVEVRYFPRGRFFWDERAATLEDQVLMPIQSIAEMGQTLPKLFEILGSDPDYAELYRKAFGDPKVTRERTAKALAQFVRSLVSYRSKYDVEMAESGDLQAEFANFTPKENRGKHIFLRNCAVCHLPNGQAAVFTMARSSNNGLDADAKGGDLGVGDVTFNRFQAGVFKSPSLRNVEFTGPYMHDGRMQTLEQVVEHYSSGVKDHPNLDGFLRGPRGRLRLDGAEKAALVAFLKTLSDQAFLSDPKFADPFVQTRR